MRLEAIKRIKEMALLKRLNLSAEGKQDLHISHYRKDCGDAHDAIERLATENLELLGVLEECADDLEVAIAEKYGNTASKYPDMKRRQDRDMAVVKKAREILERYPGKII
jgi:hypothetical protein